MINTKTLTYLALGIVLGFIILSYLEIKEYYFTAKSLKNKNTNTKKPEHYADIPLNLTDDKYSSIFDYLEKVEDPKLYVNTLGCFDNDQMIEDIKGVGETCKTWAPKVMDIYNKEPPKKTSNVNQLPSESEKDAYFLIDDKVYSFAEICPVTSNQSRPITCLYNEADKFQQMGIKLGNIIEETQDKHENKMNLLDNNMGYHIVDNNRLYNKEHIKDFIGYENYLGMNKDVYRNINDKITDLSLFGKKMKNILN